MATLGMATLGMATLGRLNRGKVPAIVGFILAAVALSTAACSGATSDGVQDAGASSLVTSAPSEPATTPTAATASASSSAMASATAATGWTVSTLPGTPFDWAGERCGYPNVVALPARSAIQAVEGTWELQGKSTMSGFPVTARIVITATDGVVALGEVPIDDEEVSDRVAFGKATWTQEQQGTIDGVAMTSTSGGVGEWQYFPNGDVRFNLQATQPVVVTVDGEVVTFPMQWPEWKLSDMTWKAQGCAP